MLRHALRVTCPRRPEIQTLCVRGCFGMHKQTAHRSPGCWHIWASQLSTYARCPKIPSPPWLVRRWIDVMAKTLSPQVEIVERHQTRTAPRFNFLLHKNSAIKFLPPTTPRPCSLGAMLPSARRKRRRTTLQQFCSFLWLPYRSFGQQQQYT